MKNKDFKDMLISVRQAGEIMKGKKLDGMRESYRLKPLTAKEVMEIRKELDLTQVVFAHMVGESPSAVQHWEQGIRRPSGAASRLLRIIKNHPELASELK